MDKYFDYEEIDDEKKVKHVGPYWRDMQRYCGMNCKLIEDAKVSQKLRIGIE
jgi:hypothetical protein